MKIVKIIVALLLLYGSISELMRVVKNDLVSGRGFVGVVAGFVLVVGIAAWLLYSASKTKK